jgi:hypothetical protein
MIEEMCAAYWRQRRAWSIETALLDKHIARPIRRRDTWKFCGSPRNPILSYLRSSAFIGGH